MLLYEYTMSKTYKSKKRKKTEILGYRTADFFKKKAAVPKMPKSIYRVQQHKV